MEEHCIIVSHGSCPDGAASIVLAKNIYPQAEYVCGSHECIDEQVLEAAQKIRKGGLLYIADICCSEEVLNEVCAILMEKKCRLHIYEHHISRSFLAEFKLPEGLEGEVVFMLDRCGSKIFFDTNLPRYPELLQEYARLIVLTNDRDMWNNEHMESAKLSALHAIYGDDRYIGRFLKNPSVTFTEREQIMLDYEKELMMRRMHRLLSEIEIGEDKDGIPYGVMVGEGKASELCNTAIHKYNLEYVLLLDYNGKRASIRSNKYFDCAKFSARFGGGGHERASGFPLEREDFKIE
ncbi:MAG: hypothetical protein HQL32_04315 [Planctomycetes bacterium]|nr:hypothetical protein [Planctomycetota bacterium]